MGPSRPKIALDANVLIAGVLLPRWPFEVMRAVLRGGFGLALPVQVIEEASRHLQHPAQAATLRLFLDETACETLPMPPPDLVHRNLDLVRSEKDVPIALALLAGSVETFVTSDRDFTDPDATAERFRARVHVVLPAVFLRDVVGWSSEALEAIRHRTWNDLENG